MLFDTITRLGLLRQRTVLWRQCAGIPELCEEDILNSFSLQLERTDSVPSSWWFYSCWMMNAKEKEHFIVLLIYHPLDNAAALEYHEKLFKCLELHLWELIFHLESETHYKSANSLTYVS